MFDAHCHIGERSDDVLVCTSALSEYTAVTDYCHRAYGLLWPEKDESRRMIETLEADRGAICGEIGLDRRFKKDADIPFMENMLSYLCQNRRPFVLHMVGRTNDMLSLLKEHRDLPPFMVHGFTGSYETARTLVFLGGTISIGPRSLRTRDIDRLLTLPFVLESDMKVSDQQRQALESVYLSVADHLGLDIPTLEEMIGRNLLSFLR